MPCLRYAVLLLSSGVLFAGDPVALAAGTIMARVAENQDRAVQLRSQYIYQQHIHIATRRKNGKLVRQEVVDYLITPTPTGIEKQVQKMDGKYFEKGKYLEFHEEPAPKRDGFDGDLIHDLREDLLNEKSKDGMAVDLFPFTANEQKKYQFELLGEQVVDGRKTYRLRFRPADKNDISWAGEALIDAEEFQPVSVFTKLSRKIPMAIRTMLGTDLPGVGFSVRYQRFDKDIWFPVSFGTEFRLHILFFLNRDIAIASSSSGFRRVNVESSIQFATPQ